MILKSVLSDMYSTSGNLNILITNVSLFSLIHTSPIPLSPSRAIFRSSPISLPSLQVCHPEKLPHFPPHLLLATISTRHIHIASSFSAPDSIIHIAVQQVTFSHYSSRYASRPCMKHETRSMIHDSWFMLQASRVNHHCSLYSSTPWVECADAVENYPPACIAEAIPATCASSALCIAYLIFVVIHHSANDESCPLAQVHTHKYTRTK